MLCVAGVMGSLFLPSAVRAEEDGPGKGKGKGKSDNKGNVIQIDLDKLPPGLAKQVMKYAQAQKFKGPAAPRKTQEGLGAFVKAQLAKGKRGRALAAAIHKEQERRGMKAKSKGKAEPLPAPKEKKKGPKAEDDD
jgi:hypothetical protein